MRKVLLFLILIHFFSCGYGQIIADHTVVDEYNKIPKHYIDEVKKMLVDVAGESHSLGYRIGIELLSAMDTLFSAISYDGTPAPASSQHLRLGRHDKVGEEEFFTSQDSINRYKKHIDYQFEKNNPFSVMAFGWCWDMTMTNPPGGTQDPVYKVRWAGASKGGPQGNMRWGLDEGDSSNTGNSICMNTYFDAIQHYNDHCVERSYPTVVIYTTGPVDGSAGDESAFQREIKHTYIREYVKESDSRILFDYADILCWNNAGEQSVAQWNDKGTLRAHPYMHDDNMKDYDSHFNIIEYTEDGDHIGEVGALRLAKAMWWLLARVAGWDGITTEIPVTGISILTDQDPAVINVDKGSLQLAAEIQPSDASNKNVLWEIISGNEHADLHPDGLLSAVSDGTVVVKATSDENNQIFDELRVLISNQVIHVSQVLVSSLNGDTSINNMNDTLQLSAEILPLEATNKTVTWSVSNLTGEALIDQSGKLMPVSNGTVMAMARSNENRDIFGELVVTIDATEISANKWNNKTRSTVNIEISDEALLIHSSEFLSNKQVCLYNISGKLFIQKKFNGNNLRIYTSALPPGIYIMILTGKDLYFKKKILLERD